MLIALLTMLFLGGGTSNAVLEYVADVTPEVKEHVADDTRRAAALTTLKEELGPERVPFCAGSGGHADADASDPSGGLRARTGKAAPAEARVGTQAGGRNGQDGSAGLE